MIFVTGGTGITGSRLLYELCRSGNEVQALRRPSSSMRLLHQVFKSDRHLLDMIRWTEGDISDSTILMDLVSEGDEVYHCAGLVSFNPSDRKKLYITNITGTENIVNACLEKKAAKLVHVSSVAALGRPGGSQYIDENSHWEPAASNSDYAVSKYASEREVWRGIAEGLNAVIVNPSVIIGAGLASNGSGGIIAKADKGLSFYTEGVSGFTDARDVAAIMIRLMKSSISAERFIVSSQNISYRELFILIAESLNKKPPAIRASPWMAKAMVIAESVRKTIFRSEPLITKHTAASAYRKYYYSNEKIKKALDYSFIPVAESIKEACRMYKEMQADRVQAEA